jgi:hypothetical protein
MCRIMYIPAGMCVFVCGCDLGCVCGRDCVPKAQPMFVSVSVSVSVLCVACRQGQVVHASVTHSVIFSDILVIAVTEPLSKLD